VAEAPTRIDLGVPRGTILTVRAGAIALIGSLVVPAIILIVGRAQAYLLAAWASNLVCLAFGVWTSRVYFAAVRLDLARRSAPLAAVAILFATAILLWGMLAEGATLPRTAGTVHPWTWAILASGAVTETIVIVFALRAYQFGAREHGVWIAIGVLHIVSAGSVAAFCCTYLVLLSRVFGVVGLHFIALIAGLSIMMLLTYPAALICHTIGLFNGARELASLRALGTAFD